jgi:DNA polymerase III gamma/tau subunit
MDPQEAKKILKEHTKALNTLLGNEGTVVSADAPDADEALEGIENRDEKLSFLRQLLKKAKELPVVETLVQLGPAGSVAVTTAAVTQVELAQSTTEQFVSEIANDVVEQRIEAPQFVHNFVDFEEINDWGQFIIAERYVAAQTYASEVSEQIQTKIQTGEIPVSKPSSSDASPSQTSAPEQQPQSESEPSAEQKPQSEQAPEKSEPAEEPKEEKAEKQSEVKEESKQEEPKQEAKESNEPKEEPQQEEPKQSEEQSPSSEPTPEPEPVKPPRIETPIFEDDIKPHRSVSPTM